MSIYPGNLHLFLSLILSLPKNLSFVVVVIVEEDKTFLTFMRASHREERTRTPQKPLAPPIKIRFHATNLRF